MRMFIVQFSMEDKHSADECISFVIFQVRIAEGEHPQDIKESDYFTERGEFRVDSEGSPTLLNCLMYKLSYYRYSWRAIIQLSIEI